ncbi:MAG: hypothetical protein ACE360_02895 [Hyphomicrobiales bacterium]
MGVVPFDERTIIGKLLGQRFNAVCERAPAVLLQIPGVEINALKKRRNLIVTHAQRVVNPARIPIEEDVADVENDSIYLRFAHGNLSPFC